MEESLVLESHVAEQRAMRNLAHEERQEEDLARESAEHLMLEMEAMQWQNLQTDERDIAVELREETAGARREVATRHDMSEQQLLEQDRESSHIWYSLNAELGWCKQEAAHAQHVGVRAQEWLSVLHRLRSEVTDEQSAVNASQGARRGIRYYSYALGLIGPGCLASRAHT